MGAPGGGGGEDCNPISDLGVESAVSDFALESFFLTPFQGHLLDFNIPIPTQHLRQSVLGWGGGIHLTL